jgi:hypothetical protein
MVELIALQGVQVQLERTERKSSARQHGAEQKDGDKGGFRERVCRVIFLDTIVEELGMRIDVRESILPSS